MKKLQLLTISVFICTTLISIPLEPPVGKRWVLNIVFTYKFNGTKVDDSKSSKYDPIRAGYPHAILLPSQESEVDGYFQIKNKENDVNCEEINQNQLR